MIIKMNKHIEFQESNPNASATISRWPGPKIQFEDLILKPDYSDTKARLPEGTCIVRVLPTIKDSDHWWLPLEVLCYSGGQHAHPKTNEPNAQSVFDLARAWFKQNAPKALYTKFAGKGFKLWTQPMAACWLLVTHENQTNLKLLVSSAFAGATGQKPGLAYQLMEFVQRNQQLLDPNAKFAIEVTRSLTEGSKYLETEFRLIESEKCLNECIAELPSEQIKMVCPVEQTIERIEQDQEWKLLEKAIGSQWTDKIRSSSQQ